MTDDTPGTKSNVVEKYTGATTTTPNILLRLFRGEVSLYVTYWIYGSLVGVGLGVVQTAIEANYYDLVSTEVGSLAIAGFYWFVVGYTLFILVAIWRSAGKYDGRPVWATLARLAVLFGILAAAGGIFSGLAQRTDSDQALREAFVLRNQSLPSMIDDEIRFDRISLQGQDIHYDYTLVARLVAELDVERFATLITAKLKTDKCESDEMRPYLDDGRNIVHMFRDKQSDPVAKIVVTGADCL